MGGGGGRRSIAAWKPLPPESWLGLPQAPKFCLNPASPRQAAKLLQPQSPLETFYCQMFCFFFHRTRGQLEVAGERLTPQTFRVYVSACPPGLSHPPNPLRVGGELPQRQEAPQPKPWELCETDSYGCSTSLGSASPLPHCHSVLQCDPGGVTLSHRSIRWAVVPAPPPGRGGSPRSIADSLEGPSLSSPSLPQPPSPLPLSLSLPFPVFSNTTTASI